MVPMRKLSRVVMAKSRVALMGETTMEMKATGQSMAMVTATASATPVAMTSAPMMGTAAKIRMTISAKTMTAS